MGMPSVERFEDADFQALARRKLESAAECAICLANVEVGEDWGVLCRDDVFCLVVSGGCEDM